MMSGPPGANHPYPRCGVCVELVPWAESQSWFTYDFEERLRRRHYYSRALPDLGAVVLKTVEYHFEYHFWVLRRNGGIVLVTPSPLYSLTSSRGETL
jgi:hypothetical protein